MKRTILTSLAIVTACAASAIAADIDGSLTVGGNISNITGNKAKANEYRNLGSGGFGGFDLNYRSPESFFDAEGNLKVTVANETGTAQSNQNSVGDLLIKGGSTDSAKFSLLYNEIPHNITYGAQTFLNGAGTSVLTSPLVPASTVPTVANTAGLWKGFDYSTNRQIYGAEMELSLKTPFFVSAGVNHTEINGIKPFGFTTALREVPAPVDYTTDTLNLQTGYRSKQLIFTVDGALSTFKNNNNFLYIGQIGAGAAGIAYLPPDNDFYKIGTSVSYKLPFWSTTMMARGSHSVLESDPTLIEGPVATIGTKWNGKRTYDSASASIASTPTKNLNTRLFYSYLNNDNGSQPLLYVVPAPAPNSAYNNPVSQVGYTKQNGGIDVSYALPAATRISGGYEYADVRRSTWATTVNLATAGSPHATKTTDNTVYIQVKNNLSDLVSGKLRYEHMLRLSDFPDLNLYNYTQRAGFFMPFETADKNMDAIKAELEFEPMHGLSLGLQYSYKMNRYKDSPLGVHDDTRHGLYVDASYVAGIAKLNVYGEAESVETNANFFAGTVGQPPTTTSNFFWSSKRNDMNYAAGGKLAVDIVPNRLSMTSGYRYAKANGSNDFALSNAAIMTTPWSNVTALDDSIRHSVDTKLTFKADKSWSFDLGYMYEHLKYADTAYTNYTYVVGTNYLTGAFNNPNYDASIFYLSTKYVF